MEKKQQTLVDPKASEMPKTTILIHSRSISTDDPSIEDRCYVVQEKITGGEVTRRTEGKKYLDQNETEMTPEELQKFEEDWSKLWKEGSKKEGRISETTTVHEMNVKVRSPLSSLLSKLWKPRA